MLAVVPSLAELLQWIALSDVRSPQYSQDDTPIGSFLSCVNVNVRGENHCLSGSF